MLEWIDEMIVSLRGQLDLSVLDVVIQQKLYLRLLKEVTEKVLLGQTGLVGYRWMHDDLYNDCITFSYYIRHAHEVGIDKSKCGLV